MIYIVFTKVRLGTKELSSCAIYYGLCGGDKFVLELQGLICGSEVIFFFGVLRVTIHGVLVVTMSSALRWWSPGDARRLSALQCWIADCCSCALEAWRVYVAFHWDIVKRRKGKLEAWRIYVAFHWDIVKRRWRTLV